MKVSDGTQLFRKGIRYTIYPASGDGYRVTCFPEGMQPKLVTTPFGEAVRKSPLAAVAAANRDMDERGQ